MESWHYSRNSSFRYSSNCFQIFWYYWRSGKTTHRACLEARDQFCGVSALLHPLRGSWASNSGHQASKASSFTGWAISVAPQQIVSEMTTRRPSRSASACLHLRGKWRTFAWLDGGLCSFMTLFFEDNMRKYYIPQEGLATRTREGRWDAWSSVCHQVGIVTYPEKPKNSTLRGAEELCRGAWVLTLTLSPLVANFFSHSFSYAVVDIFF